MWYLLSTSLDPAVSVPVYVANCLSACLSPFLPASLPPLLSLGLCSFLLACSCSYLPAGLCSFLPGFLIFFSYLFACVLSCVIAWDSAVPVWGWSWSAGMGYKNACFLCFLKIRLFMWWCLRGWLEFTVYVYVDYMVWASEHVCDVSVCVCVCCFRIYVGVCSLNVSFSLGGSSTCSCVCTFRVCVWAYGLIR